MSGGGAPAIRRHPSEATLVAHAAGTLWVAAKPVVQGHLALCEHCRIVFGLAEAVGGTLLDELPATPLSPDALRRVTERLGGRAGAPAQPAASPAPAAVAEEAAMSPLGLRDVRLRWLAPGVRHAVLLRGPAEGTLRLLRVRPGTALPRHAHRGTELTLVLEGAFADETGRHGSVRARANWPVWPAAAPLVGIGTSGGWGPGWSACAAARRRWRSGRSAPPRATAGSAATTVAGSSTSGVAGC